MTTPIDITQATATQAATFTSRVPALVRATGPASYDFQFGERPTLFDDFITASWRTPETLFSYAVSRVALSGGDLVGLEIGFVGPDFYRLRDNLAGIAAGMIANGKATAREMSALAERAETASYLNAHVPNDVYYVLALSVPEPCRGRGIGARLLTHAIDRARAAGHRALHLDVLADNPATHFYRTMGLTTLAETRSPELSRTQGFPSELRMAIALR